MNSSVAFKSQLFQPLLKEKVQICEGRYGFELAWWLVQELQYRNVAVGYPICVEGTWVVPYQTKQQQLAICVENLQGSKKKWRIFIRLLKKQTLKKKKLGIADIETVVSVLVDILEEEPNISNIDWYKG